MTLLHAAPVATGEASKFYGYSGQWSPLVTDATREEERIYTRVHTHLALRAACGVGSWRENVTKSIAAVHAHGCEINPHQIY